MSDSGIFRVKRLPPGVLNHLDHRPAAFNRHNRIVGAVKSPDGYILDSICVAHISAAANRDRSSEPLRMPYQSLPNGVAYHGNSGDVDAISIDRVVVLDHI